MGRVQWQFYLYVIALFILTASSSALQYWLFLKQYSRGSQQEGIDDHFDKINREMESKRGNLVQFKGIFSKDDVKPKVLSKKRVSTSSYSEYSGEDED